MKLLVPDYYPSFRCMADRCRHTCCAGWEICIDDDTLSYYNSLPGSMGDRIRRSITVENGEACFSLTEDERCPMLSRSGLCDIITVLGEDSLCSICADHPRYRHHFGTITQMGLGLCCEAAAALILRRTEPAALIVQDNDGTAPDLAPEDADYFLALRQALAVVQDRSVPLARREESLLALFGVLYIEETPEQAADFYRTLEVLDPAWLARLDDFNTAKAPCPHGSVVMREQLLVYFLMRHLAEADNGDYAVPAAFAVHTERLIATLAQSDDDLVELARMVSSEIEYSDENLPAVMDFLAARLTDIP